jgi:hypothetical protein
VRPFAVIAVAAMVLVATTLVVLSVRKSPVATYAPTAPASRDAGRGLVGPVLYTVDATSPDQWRYFSFRFGSVLENASAKDWDLAFRRYQIIANGGPRFAGDGGVVDLGQVAFDDVKSVPDAGYQVTEGDAEPRHPALAGWYSYSYFSHVLSPKPRVWAVRLADRRYAKVEFISYYCLNLEPGCLTFRYVYQGDGSRNLGGGLRQLSEQEGDAPLDSPSDTPRSFGPLRCLPPDPDCAGKAGARTASGIDSPRPVISFASAR